MPENRPVPRPRRRPRPAPDEDVDPVVPALAAVPSSPAPPSLPARQFALPVDIPRRRRGTPTVQVNVRLPGEIAALLDAVTDATGALKSDVIESAIRHAYDSPES